MLNPLAVLIVDDFESLRRVLLRYFEMAGYTVESASSVHEANNILSTGYAPDVIISDFNMPGGTGLDLLKDIRRQDPNIPFVIMSADPTNKVAAMANGATVFWGKGDAREFLKVIKKFDEERKEEVL